MIKICSVVIIAMLFFSTSFAKNDEIYKKIANDDALSSLSEVCPSELVQSKDIEFENLTAECGETQNYCLKRCLKGSSDHCFGLANHFNISDGLSHEFSRPLYAKSCELGLASACTNVAAGLKSHDGLDQAQCYTETFQKTCESDDPWGCTMYSVSLIYAEGTAKDLDKALSVLRRSCRFGETDRACSTALDLASSILLNEFDD